MDTSEHARYPILGALYHPPGGIIRHDAVVWGYARAADSLGVHIHQDTEVQDIVVENDRVRGVQTNQGNIATNVVVNCTAGYSSLISSMAGVRMPIGTFPLQAAVTERVKPFLHTVVVSGTLHVYVSQTDRGELVFGASVDPFTSYSTRGSLEFIEGLAGHVLELMPALSKLRLLRQWAGLCDMTPDYSPIMGVTPVEGFYVDVGWGNLGLQSRSRLGRGDGEARRHRQAAGDHRTFRPGPIPRRPARRRERSRGRWTLKEECRDPASLPLLRSPATSRSSATPERPAHAPTRTPRTPHEWRDYLYTVDKPGGLDHREVVPRDRMPPVLRRRTEHGDE